MNNEVLAAAWSLAHQGKTATSVDIPALNAVCYTLLRALSGEAVPPEAEEWTQRIVKCPRTAGLMISGLSQILTRNFRTLESRFKQLINTLVSRYEELFQIQLVAESEESDNEDKPRQKKKRMAKKKLKAIVNEQPENTSLVLSLSPDLAIRQPVAKLTQDMSWLNDPKFIVEMTAVDSLIHQQLSQSGQAAVEKSFKSLLGNIERDEPFIVEEADDSFFQFNRTTNREMQEEDAVVHMYESHTPANRQVLIEEDVHMHEKSAVRPPFDPSERLKKKGKAQQKNQGPLKVQKAQPDEDVSVTLGDQVPARGSLGGVGLRFPLNQTPTWWLFASEFLGSGKNILQTYIVRDKIASNCDASDWSQLSIMNRPIADPTPRSHRDSMFSFGGSVPPPAQTPLGANVSLPSVRTQSLQPSLAQNTEILSQALSAHSTSTSANRAVALKRVLDEIFSRSREPVPWTCVLPASAVRWQAAVCVGALVQLLGQGQIIAHQQKSFGPIDICVAGKRALDRDDKENKKPRVV